MEELIQQLHQGNYSCVIAKGKDIRTFTQRGVADLYSLLKNDPDFLQGAQVADKVIGKAAATLMILGGVKHIYTDLISQPALDLISTTDISIEYKGVVPYIQNRDKSGWCPLEKMTYDEQLVENSFILIENFIIQIKNNRAGIH